MNRADLLHKLKSISNLPTLPVIVTEVNRLLIDYDSPLEQLAGLLEKDQILAIKLLRLVNSSFYGLRSKVKSLRHAVTLMGYNTVRNAIVSVAVMDTLALKNELDGFEIESFWRHSISVAVMSRHLALKTHLSPADDAFTAGLLHDIGKVVLANFFPETLLMILQEAKSRQLSFFDSELELNSCTHSLIGSYLAERWLLPEMLTRAIKYHHVGHGRLPVSNLVILVDLADALAHMLARDGAYHLNLDKLPHDIQPTISVALNNGQNWLLRVRHDIAQACDFFNKG